MKAKIVALVPIEKEEREQSIKKNELDRLVNAAWHFAYSALWHHEIISPKEIENCKEFIRHYFQLQYDNKKTLVAFCERILLARQFFEKHSYQLCPPNVWLHHDNDEGFTATLFMYQHLLVRRQQVPEFRKDSQIIANYYLQYVIKPSASFVKECRTKLLALKAIDLLQVFYNSIIHIHYSN